MVAVQASALLVSAAPSTESAAPPDRGVAQVASPDGAAAMMRQTPAAAVVVQALISALLVSAALGSVIVALAESIVAQVAR